MRIRANWVAMRCRCRTEPHMQYILKAPRSSTPFDGFVDVQREGLTDCRVAAKPVPHTNNVCGCWDWRHAVGIQTHSHWRNDRIMAHFASENRVKTQLFEPGDDRWRGHVCCVTNCDGDVVVMAVQYFQTNCVARHSLPSQPHSCVKVRDIVVSVALQPHGQSCALEQPVACVPTRDTIRVAC